MLTLPVLDERAIWLVPLAFYIYDNCVLIDHRHIIIIEDFRLQWSFIISKIPFTFAGRHLYLLPPLLPFLFSFILPWRVSGKVDHRKISLYRNKNLVWRAKLRDFRMIAICAWINLYMLGPLLTFTNGFLFSLRFVLPIHIGLLALSIALIVINARLLSFDRRMILSCAAELSLSPGYLPNICRRLSLSQVCDDVDGVFFIKRYGRLSVVELIVDVIQFRLSELKFEVGEEGGPTQDIEEYSEELRV